MIIVNAQEYNERLSNTYYNKRLKENVEYRDKHGVGPYEYNGKFADRVEPYFDSGYWKGYETWLKSEFKMSLVSAFNEFHFETAEDAAWFMLRCP